MFSVIIPVYNKAKYVSRTISSVLEQTFHEFELIIVNDGSTDNSMEIIENSLSNTKRPFKIINQRNTGVSQARNNAVPECRYEYLVFLDADDWWDRDYLKEINEQVKKFKNAAVYCSSYFIYKNRTARKAEIAVDKHFKSGYLDYFNIYARTICMPVHTSCAVIKKDVFKELNGFKNNLRLGEDLDLWIRIALKYKIVLLNKPLSYYNQDVEIAGRGVVPEKIYSTEEHAIFNLDYLSNDEKSNADLKHLLDHLRVYALLRYRLHRAFPKEVNSIISKVDFSELPGKYRFYYSCPVSLLKPYFNLLKFGSRIKRTLLTKRRK